MNITEYISGEIKPECVAPRYRHTKVDGMGVLVPYCLWCGKKMGKKKND